MYTWIDGKKFSDSKYLPTVSFISRNCIPFFKNPFELNSRLPVIKEEDGYVSDDELQLPQNLLKSNARKKKKSVNQNSSCSNEPNSDSKNSEIFKDSNDSMKLPPLLNINCLMNTEIKQTQSVWDTQFGKRLIGQKNVDEELKSSGVKKIRPNSVKSCSEKSTPSQPSRAILKKKSVRTQSAKTSGSQKEEFMENKSSSNKKKSKNINKEKQNPNKKQNSNQVKSFVKKNSSETITKSTEKFSEKFSETPKKKMQENNSSISSFTKNQRFLTECVQSILDGYSNNEFHCEFCDETFMNIEDLYEHKKQHEAKKEICLLCEKVFYDANEFIQHLLTHEGVDKFSCKKCKKYFPSLRKYKHHCLQHHLTPPDFVNTESVPSVEYVKKWLPKFECKRCKMEFDSEKKHEAHRRSHIKKDLIGAYLLSSKNL